MPFRPIVDGYVLVQRELAFLPHRIAKVNICLYEQMFTLAISP